MTHLVAGKRSSDGCFKRLNRHHGEPKILRREAARPGAFSFPATGLFFALMAPAVATRAGAARRASALPALLADMLFPVCVAAVVLAAGAFAWLDDRSAAIAHASPVAAGSRMAERG